MNESQETSTSNDSIASAKKTWEEAIAKLASPFQYQTIRDRLNSQKYWFKLPNEALTYDGYNKILAHLQDLRNDIVKEKLVIDEHSDIKIAALKNLQTIFPGTYDKETYKTDKQREAKAAYDLKNFTVVVAQANSLRKMADSILNNVDSAIAQVNRQMKSVEMGIKTSSVTTTDFKDWDKDEPEDEEETLLNSWGNLNASNDEE